MSLSGRSSGRVAESFTNDLVGGARGANGRADGQHPAGASYGRRQLVRLRSTLSDRDLAVLGSVGALHFVTTRQIERLYFHRPDTTPLAAARAARRSLARFFDLHLLDRLERRIGGVRAGSASFVWRLAPAGVRLLGDGTRRRSREPSLVHLAHVLDVADLVVRLHELVRHDAAVELLSVETEPACWRPLVGHHGARVMLKPDLRLTVGVDEHELHWFVELDRGTEYRVALTRKLHAYLAAWRDGGEQARAGVFPRVLWVVPDEERAEVIEGVWQSLSSVPPGMFLAVTNDRAVRVLATASVGGRP